MVGITQRHCILEIWNSFAVVCEQDRYLMLMMVTCQLPYPVSSESSYTMCIVQSLYMVCCFLLGRKSHIAAWLTNMPHGSYQAWFNMEWYIPLFRTSIASAFSTNMTLLILKACRKAFSSSLTLKLLLYTCNHQNAVFQSLRPKGGCQKPFYIIRPQRERGGYSPIL